MVVPIDVNKYVERISYSSDMLEEYHGWALPGISTSTQGWLIRKIEYNSNKLHEKTLWAEGKTNFDKKWTLRDTYSYS